MNTGGEKSRPGGEQSRPDAETGGERLLLHAALIEAQDESRAVAARLRRSEAELETEREERTRDAEWFRDRVEELRAAAEEVLQSERSSADLRGEIDARDALAAELRDAVDARDELVAELRAAIEARDALLAELRGELETSMRAETERLEALGAMRERATALEHDEPPPPPEPAPEPEPARESEPNGRPEPVPSGETEAAPEPEPAPAAETAAPQPAARRFERKPAWPKAVAGLHRAEIEWHPGYVNSQFRAVAYPPNRRRGSTLAAGATFKWQLMGDPDRGQPEFATEVRRLADALEAAGWEPIGEGGAWYAHRYAWRGDEPPPARLTLRPLQTSAGAAGGGADDGAS